MFSIMLQWYYNDKMFVSLINFPVIKLFVTKKLKSVIQKLYNFFRSINVHVKFSVKNFFN